MSKFGIIEDTLFIPLLGRIYASERYPHILYDKSALNLKLQLPLTEQPHQSQYALLASACRAANMDRFVRNFLTRKPDGSTGLRTGNSLFPLRQRADPLVCVGSAPCD